MPLRRAERLEKRGLGLEVSQDSGYGEEGSQESSMMLKDKKKGFGKKKWSWILAILVVVIVVGAVTGVLIIKPWESGGEGESTGANGEILGEQGEEKEEEMLQLKELDVNDELVQGIYKDYRATELSDYVDKEAFMAGVGMASRKRLAFDALVDGSEPIKCSASVPPESVGVRIGEQLGETFYSPQPVADECYRGEDFRQKVEEMFGVQVELENGELIATNRRCSYVVYSAETDEIYSAMFGCGSRWHGITKHLYKAEQLGDVINLYEAVAGVDVIFPGDSYETIQYNVFKLGMVDTEGIERNRWGLVMTDLLEKVRGEQVCSVIKSGEELEMNFVQECDYERWNKYQWTFKRNEVGNYVFEKLEKVE